LDLLGQRNYMFIYENLNLNERNVLNRDISTLTSEQISFLNQKISGREEIDKFSEKEFECYEINDDKYNLRKSSGKF